MTDKTRLETILVLALASSLIGLLGGHAAFHVAAAVLLALAIVSPTLSGYLASAWLTLGAAMGRVSSALLLGIVYFFVLTPMGIFARLTRRLAPEFDSKTFEPRLRSREHDWSAKDLDNPW